MAFEQNQQDAFNLRNDTESLKRLEAELDKATTAIGAAEVAAEEELAAQKLKNLAALQEARLKKLNELIEKEEAGIRKLAALRLELSDKQFEARKKEIQKELQLLEKAKKELLEAEVVKPKKSEDSAKKQAPNAKGIASESKAKPTISGKKIPVKNSGKSTDSDLIKLVSSIDRTLGSLRKTVTGYVQSNGKSSPANNTSQQAPTTTTAIKAIQATAKNNPTEATTTPKLNNVPIQNFDVDKEAFKDTTQPEPISLESPIDKALDSLLDTTAKYSQFKEQNLASDANTPQTTVSESKNEAQSELITLISSINKTLESLLGTVANQSKEKDFSTADDPSSSKIDDIKNAVQPPQSDNNYSGNPTDGGDDNSKSGLGQEDSSKNKEFSNNSDDLPFLDIGKTSLQAFLDGFAVIRGALGSSEEEQDKRISENPTLKLLNDIAAKGIGSHKEKDEKVEKDGTEVKPPEPQLSQTTLDLGGELLKNIEEARKAEEALQKFKEDQELNTQLLKQNREQERLKELKEAELKSIEEQAKIEADIAFNQAHSDEIAARELQQKRIDDQKSYQEYLKEAGEFAVSQEEFINNKKQKELQESKNKATSGITDAIKSGQFSKIFSTDNKEAVSRYMNQRTAELKDSYMAKFDEDNPEATEEERAKAEENAKASAKLSAGFELVADAAKNLAQTLNAQTDKIGAKQAPIDTRLQGSKANDTILGSYWKQLARDMNKIGAVNPYFAQENFASNIETLVNKGISFDIKQRAFLMTIQEKIANTFDVADGTLLRLIRIQQQDTTAGRLGMESALNSFLNSMYETSEYLTDVASSVRGSLEELQSLMEGAAGTELEFQIQKWMGSLYSVGMSQDAVQSIAQTFGQIASGDISGLTGDGTSNLLIMAANEAGMSIADILQKGLDADETNKLLQATVNYLAEIAKDSSDSRVVQQQLANVFGMKASDLRAATNLASSVKAVSNQDLTYSGMLGQLNKMANSMILRTSTGEMLTNVWDNVQYTMATQMANDPILYLLPRVATLLEEYAGGIDLPFINIWGFGLDLNTSVAQLMNVLALSGSILGALGPMISGLSAAASGSIMLSMAGIDTSGKAPVIARGAPATLQNVSGSSISESGYYIGNSSGEDVKNATLQDAEDDKKKQMVEAKDESSDTDLVTRANQAVIDIYNLLEEVAHGTQSLRVHVVGGLNGGSSKEDNGNWVLSF